MPAIITHDQFGHAALAQHSVPFVTTEQERNAFLLGNQGPDPLFYCVIDPRLRIWHGLGSRMHHDSPSRLLAALSETVSDMPATSQAIARAYSAGFLCHYLLDRTAHPLVYAQQFALCDAGIEGLTRKDGSEVHALIESELDEMMLYTRTHQTIATYAPQRSILRANEQTLAIISYAISRAVTKTYDLIDPVVPPHLFTQSVHAFRLIQGIFHSPHGTKRALLGALERTVRPHSFVQAMMHRSIALEHCTFDNHHHEPWVNPFTHTAHTASFLDLFEEALCCAHEVLPSFGSKAFSLQDAQALTRGLDFSGEPIDE